VLVGLALGWRARPMSPGHDVPPQEPDDLPTPADVLDGQPEPGGRAQVTALPADPIAARTFIEGLFARHRGEIYAYLLRMLRDPELAADLAQDAFVRAYRAHADLDDRPRRGLALPDRPPRRARRDPPPKDHPLRPLER